MFIATEGSIEKGWVAAREGRGNDKK